MKKMLLLIAFIATVIFVNAQAQQPCKVVKIGMSKAEVLKLVGPPTDTVGLGADVIDNKRLPLVLWNYGNQQVDFSGDKVEKVIADVKKENELAFKVSTKEVTSKEYQKLLSKINEEACK